MSGALPHAPRWTALRDAAWLHRDRARAYARLLALAMAATLLLNWAAIVTGWAGGTRFDPKPGNTDFLAFWSAGRLALARGGAAAYDHTALLAVQKAAARNDGDGIVTFFYPPVALLAAAPIALLPYLPGFAVWVAAQTALLLRLLRALAPRAWGWWPILGFGGWLVNAATGQNGFFTASAFAGGALLLDRRPLLAGACLGLLAAKPHLAIAVPVVLAAAGRWRALLACGATAAALAALSAAAFGLDAWRAFAALGPLMRAGLAHHAEDWGRLMTPYALLRHAGLPFAPALLAQGLAGAALLLAAARAARRIQDGAALVGLAALAGLMATPHVFDYDLAILAVPLAWLAAAAARDGWRPWEKLAAAAAWFLPFWARFAAMQGITAAPFLLTALLAVLIARATSHPAPKGARHALA